jgi:hypothetical protein
MEIWAPTPIAKVRGIVLRLLMVVSAKVETTNRVVVSLIDVLDARVARHGGPG